MRLAGLAAVLGWLAWGPVCQVSWASSGPKAQIDSLKQALARTRTKATRAATLCELCKAWLGASQPDSAFLAGERGLALARHAGVPRTECECVLALSGVLFQQGKFEDLYTLTSGALPLFEQQNDKRGEIRCHHYLGGSQMMLGKYPRALEHYQNCLRLSEQLRDSVLIGRALGSLGNVYESLEDYPQAHRFQSRSLAIFEALNYEIGIGIATNNLGNALRGLGRHEEALDQYVRSTDIDRRMGTRYDVAIGLVNIGLALLRLNRPDEALTYLHESLAIRQELNDPWGIAGSHLSLADVYASKHQWRTVREHAEQALAIAGPIKHQIILEKASFLHFQADSALGDYQSALRMHIRYKQYADSLHNDKQSKELGRIESQYRYQKEAEIERQVNQNRTLWIVGTALGALLLLSALAFTMYRGRRKARLANQSLQSLLMAVEVQKAEIEAQNSEIIAQRDQLESTNERLNSLSRMKDELSGMIVHDLKNPLNSILSMAALPPDEGRLSVIRGAGQQMSQLILNLLDVQKYESDALVLHRQPTSALQLIQAAIGQTDFLAQPKGITVRVDCPDQLEVWIDRELMLRVWVNLLTNAIKFAPVGDELQVSARLLPDQSIRLSLTDHGLGIASDRLEFIFDKYAQLDSGQHSGQFRSTGLGLTFCRLTVEAHGGHIRAFSKPGRFTTFELDLPHGNLPHGTLVPIQQVNAIELPMLPAELWHVHANQLTRLRTIPVYEMGAILDILENLPKEPAILAKWKSTLEFFALAGYAEGYLKLLEPEAPA